MWITKFQKFMENSYPQYQQDINIINFSIKIYYFIICVRVTCKRESAAGKLTWIGGLGISGH